MGPTTSELLIERLDQLERELRWWRRAGLATFFVLAAVVTMGQLLPTARAVEAEKFVLKDAKGKVRAVLGPEDLPGRGTPPPLQEPGWYGLYFYDSEGAYRASLRESDIAWELELDAKKTPSSASLMVGDDFAWLNFRATTKRREVADREWTARSKQLKAAQTPEAREELSRGSSFDGVEASLAAWPSGLGHFRLTQGLGGGLDFSLVDRQPSLYLSDPKGTTRVVVGHTKLERQATGVTEERPLSSIVLFNKEGGVIWKAP
jgi:hypothetical protein